MNDVTHPILRAVLLPKPIDYEKEFDNFLWACCNYPLRLCELRATASGMIPVPPQENNDQQFIKVPRELKEKNRATQLLDIKTKISSDLQPQQMSLLEVVKKTYADRGILGFYEGFPRNFALDRLETLLTCQIQKALESLYERRVDSGRPGSGVSDQIPAAGEVLGEASAGAILASESDTSGLSLPKLTVGPTTETNLSTFGRARSQLTKMNCSQYYSGLRNWLASYSYSDLMIYMASRCLTSGIIYPLRTVSLRCDIYKPFDRRPMSFLQMSRCSIAYDGTASLYKGFKRHLIYKFMTDATLMGQQAVLKTIPEDKTLFKLFASWSLSAVSCTYTRLDTSGCEDRLTSNIPGLISEDCLRAQQKKVYKGILWRGLF